jgi:hypothetical protein
MTKQEVMNRLRELNNAMYQWNLIAMNINGESDDVIRARKEISRIKHDITYLLETYSAA